MLIAFPLQADGLLPVLQVAASLDPDRGVGSLLALTEGGGSTTLQERPGWMVQDLFRLRLEGRRAVLALWRDLGEGHRTSPELWVEDREGSWEAGSGPATHAHAEAEAEGEAHPHGGEFELVWGGSPRIEWTDARTRLATGDHGPELRVERSLAGENRELPLARVRVAFGLAGDGVRATRLRDPLPETQAQRLNLLDEMLHRGDLARAAGLLSGLEETHRERAAVVIARHAIPGTEAEPLARRLLDQVAMAGGSVGRKAAEAQLELDWRSIR